MKTIVLATPHVRNDSLFIAVTQALPDFRVVRISRPEDLTKEHLSALDASWVFFPHWSWIIHPELFDNFRCVVFHMTDLPYGRGGSPLQNLIVRGHINTKLSALKCIQELDAGPIYEKRDLSLSGTAEEILQRASSLIGEMIISIVLDDPTPSEQTGDAVLFSRRKYKDGSLAGLQKLEQIYNHIRMLDADGYPSAFLKSEGLHLEFKSAELQNGWVDAKVRIRIC